MVTSRRTRNRTGILPKQVSEILQHRGNMKVGVSIEEEEDQDETANSQGGVFDRDLPTTHKVKRKTSY